MTSSFHFIWFMFYAASVSFNANMWKRFKIKCCRIHYLQLCHSSLIFKDIAGFVETHFERNMIATTLVRDVLGRQNKKTD